MTEMINKIGESLVIKARVVNLFMEDWFSGKVSGNLRSNPCYSEFRGMLLMVKAMGIEHEVIFNDDVTQMIAIDLNGKRFDI